MALFDFQDTSDDEAMDGPRVRPSAPLDLGDDDDGEDEPTTLRGVFFSQAKKPVSPEHQAFESWVVSREPKDLKAVVHQLEPTINYLVQRYAGQRVSPVVRQRARLLAARAVTTYNPLAGANLQTHVSNHLRALQRMIPNITDPLPPPERFRHDQKRIAASTEALEDEMGREVTDEEVSERTGMPLKRVTRVRGRMRARLSTGIVEDSNDADEEAPDIVGSERTRFDEWVDAVYHDLGPIDRVILSHKTGYRGSEPLSTNDLARRLNMTPAAVSQRAGRIQKRLDEFDGP